MGSRYLYQLYHSTYFPGTPTHQTSISTKMATRIGVRNVLGDITKQQNIPQKVAKVRTRQAAAKKLTPEVVCEGHEDLALERSLPAGVVDIDKKDLENQLSKVFSPSLLTTCRTKSRASATYLWFLEH